MKSFKDVVSENAIEISQNHIGGGLLKPGIEKYENKVYFAKNKKGNYSVYANTSVKDGGLLEVCPVVSIDIDEENETLLPLGYYNIYSESKTPNCKYIYIEEEQVVKIVATQFINENEELTIYKETDDEF